MLTWQWAHWRTHSGDVAVGPQVLTWQWAPRADVAVGTGPHCWTLSGDVAWALEADVAVGPTAGPILMKKSLKIFEGQGN